MPNICYNTVFIIGHKEDLDQIEAAKFSFQWILPRPASQDALWYDWNWENWGAKWDCNDFKVQMRDENQIAVTFETAWNPPIPVLRALLNRFPRSWLKLTYYVDDNSSGVWIANMGKNGQLVERSLEWVEPEARLTTSGEILLPE